MKLKSGVLLSGVVAAAIAFSAGHASAAPFAVGYGADPSALNVDYINGGASGSFLFTAPTPSTPPVSGDFAADTGGFHYDSANGFGLTSSQIIPASIILLAQSTGPATITTVAGVTTISQDLEEDAGGPLFTITALPNSLGVPTGFNLLTVSGTGIIQGVTPGTTGGFGGDSTRLVLPDTVQYTDGFGDVFTNQVWNSTILNITPGLTGSTPPLTPTVTTDVASVVAPEYIDTFTGSINGTFNASVTTGGGVPEPASLAILGLGAMGLMLSKKRSSR